MNINEIFEKGITMAIIFGIIILILGFFIWFILNTQNKSEYSNSQEVKPLITVNCKDGFIKGHYINGSLFKGKKYIAHRLAYEGTFFNGMQTGHGKEYFPNKKLKYEGNFSNDEPSGQGVLYDENGQLKYLGYFANGYASGQGRLYDDRGNLKIEGHFARMPSNIENMKDPSVPSGQCKEYYDNGQLKYEGDFHNGIWQGEGKHYDKNGYIL